MFHKKFAFDLINNKILKRRVGCPSEITQLKHTKAIEYILGLDVSMNDEIAMKVSNCSRNLSEIKRRQALLTIVSFSYLLK